MKNNVGIIKLINKDGKEQILSIPMDISDFYDFDNDDEWEEIPISDAYNFRMMLVN
jgi:hypothetical protein